MHTWVLLVPFWQLRSHNPLPDGSGGVAWRHTYSGSQFAHPPNLTAQVCEARSHPEVYPCCRKHAAAHAAALAAGRPIPSSGVALEGEGDEGVPAGVSECTVVVDGDCLSQEQVRWAGLGARCLPVCTAASTPCFQGSSAPHCPPPVLCPPGQLTCSIIPRIYAPPHQAELYVLSRARGQRQLAVAPFTDALFS